MQSGQGAAALLDRREARRVAELVLGDAARMPMDPHEFGRRARPDDRLDLAADERQEVLVRERGGGRVPPPADERAQERLSGRRGAPMPPRRVASGGGRAPPRRRARTPLPCSRSSAARRGNALATASRSGSPAKTPDTSGSKRRSAASRPKRRRANAATLSSSAPR